MIPLFTVKFFGCDDGVIIKQQIGESKERTLLFRNGHDLLTYMTEIIGYMGETVDKINKDKKWN